jgi:hypothetical protein
MRIVEVTDSYAAPVYFITWLSIHGTFSLQSFEAAMSGMYGLGQWPGLWKLCRRSTAIV